jgi:hypothetical protein
MAIDGEPKGKKNTHTILSCRDCQGDSIAALEVGVSKKTEKPIKPRKPKKK